MATRGTLRVVARSKAISLCSTTGSRQVLTPKRDRQAAYIATRLARVEVKRRSPVREHTGGGTALIVNPFRLSRPQALALPGIFAMVLGLAAGPTFAGPTVSATDHGINWGTLERHFPQNKQAESPMATNPTNALNSVTGSEDFVREPDCSTDPSTGSSVCIPGQTINTI